MFQLRHTLTALFVGSLAMAGCLESSIKGEIEDALLEAINEIEVTANTTSAEFTPDATSSLTSKDGVLTLTVPAGALTQATEIFVTPVDEAGAVAAYNLQPDGLTFQVPIVATLALNKKDFGNLGTQGTEGAGALLVDGEEVEVFDFPDSVSTTYVVGSDGVTVEVELSHFTRLLVTTDKDGNSFDNLSTTLRVAYPEEVCIGDLAFVDVSLTGSDVGAFEKKYEASAADGYTLDNFIFAGGKGITDFSPIKKTSFDPSGISRQASADGDSISLFTGGIECTEAGSAGFSILVETSVNYSGTNVAANSGSTGSISQLNTIGFRFDCIECGEDPISCPTGKVPDEDNENCVCDTGTVDDGNGGCEKGIGEFEDYIDTSLDGDDGCGVDTSASIPYFGGGDDPDIIPFLGADFRLIPGSTTVASAMNVTVDGTLYDECTLTIANGKMTLSCDGQCSEEFPDPSP